MRASASKRSSAGATDADLDRGTGVRKGGAHGALPPSTSSARLPRHVYRLFPRDHLAVRHSRRFQAVTGACLLVRKSLFLELDGFDPAFANGFEDVDFCLRAGAGGAEVHYCADSTLVHFEA